ncbi:MAG: membrane protein insertion efficiency factor YidD [Firmicutes bacterium]|nr:membrane protein insertion efficiency factor YidD [Bacillota bacterium]
MKRILIKLIKIYQSMPLHSHSACRYYPTCSNYAIEAIEIHGSIRGIILTIKRLLRCNPFNKKSGIDLVPPKK